MACGSPPGIRATAKARSLLPGNACLPEAVMPDDSGRDGLGLRSAIQDRLGAEVAYSGV